MRRRVNDDYNGLKLDKFRNSRFELDDSRGRIQRYGGMAKKTPNTLGGVFAENRGRRSAEGVSDRWDNSPFENGKIHNWKRREGWDRFYDQSFERGNRNYGGAQTDHEGSHFGKGPRGYRRSDESIYDDVCQSLELSPEVDASNVEVSVKNGIVLLEGTVSDRMSKKMAELEIENISGVHDVQNRLSIKKPDEKLH